MARYSDNAQPYLDAIGAAIFAHGNVRDWILSGTQYEDAYANARCLREEQERRRGGRTRQPFFCNYFCMSCETGSEGPNCGIPFPDGCRRTETDMMAFLENQHGHRLGIHIEFKRDGEALLAFQAEAYPLRAECWAKTGYGPQAVVPHDDWLTVIFCGDNAKDSPGMRSFDRRIGHREARAVIEDYPYPPG